MDIITSTSNQIVKYIRALKAKKARNESGTFVVEGEKFVREIAAPWEVEFFVVSEDNAEKNFSAVRHFVVSNRIFESISDVVQPQGVLAVVRQRAYVLDDMLNAETPLFLLCEDVQDPGNVGAILRIAHGLGFCGVVLSEGCADVYSPKVIRSSAGSALHVPFVTMPLPLAIATLKSRSVDIFATKASAKHMLFHLDFRPPTAFIIGNEAKGLSKDILALADSDVSIPIQSESLNASVACGILAYEAFRQRNG